MVRSYGANLTDIIDRGARDLGMVSGKRLSTGVNHPLRTAHGYGLAVADMPWWIHHGGHYPYAFDDFEGTLKWRQTMPTVSKASDTGFVHSGTSSMKMITAATAGVSAGAEFRTMPLRADPLYYTIEMWFALTAVAVQTPREFAVTWAVEDALTPVARIFGFRYVNYNATNPVFKIQYWTSGAAWADLTIVEIPIDIVNPQFHYLIFKIRRVPTQPFDYGDLTFDNYTWPLEGTAGETATASISRTVVNVYCTTDAAAATTAYVDDFAIFAGAT